MPIRPRVTSEPQTFGLRGTATMLLLTAIAAACLTVVSPLAGGRISAQSPASGVSPQPAALAGEAARSNHACEPLSSQNGKLEVTMKVPIDGSYHVWLRAKAPNADSGFTVSVDSIDKTRSCGIRVADKRRMRPFWSWLNTRDSGRYSVPLKAGTTRIQITGDPSYSDLSLDRVLLVINADCTPTMATSSCGAGAENSTPVSPATSSGSGLSAAAAPTPQPLPDTVVPEAPVPVPTGTAGDVDGDNDTDDQDLAIINRNYNKPSAGRSDGDLNGDGVVNVLDMAIHTRGRLQ